MIKRNTYLFSLFIITALLCGCVHDGSKLPSLKETYAKNDTKPFGGNIAYRQLEAMYADNIIRDKKKNFKNTWQTISDTAALYICISPQLYVNEEELQAMMEYVWAGNSLFLSAREIDDALLEKAGCKVVQTDPLVENAMLEMKNTAVNAVVNPDDKFAYYYYPFQNHFSKLDSSNTRILGYNDYKQPNFIVHFYGKGKLYLHCEPRAFSNYFLLKETNYGYLKNSLTFTKGEPQHVYWDDYYYGVTYRKDGNNGGRGTLSEINKYPSLVYAFWLSALLLLIYLLFGGKRVQRIINQIKPNENTTVTFTETVGRLYLQKKDNKNIADKMITYFNEYIRNTYFLNTNQVNADFVSVLSRKSGVDKDKVDTLYRSIVATQNSAVVNDYQLLSLHEQIQQFYKNKGNSNK